MTAEQVFDVAILGGGTAGCVLAARLSERSGREVCLIEAGPDYGPRGSSGWPRDMLATYSLGGKAFEPIIGPTCDALAEFSPHFLVPTHCTGWRATHALAARFPEAFIQNSVGTRFSFTAADA